MLLGAYGRGLNEVAAGVKKLSSDVDVDVRRRFRGLEMALVEDEPEKDNEAVKAGRDSDIPESSGV